MFLTLNRNPLRTAFPALALLVLCAGLPHSVAQGVPAANAPARARIDEVLSGLNHGRSVGQVAVSPDGKRLAWIERERGSDEIRFAPLGDLTKRERVTAAAKADEHCRENNLRWAPDSKSLAFF